LLTKILEYGFEFRKPNNNRWWRGYDVEENI
jgi:hypothetical protein